MITIYVVFVVGFVVVFFSFMPTLRVMKTNEDF